LDTLRTLFESKTMKYQKLLNVKNAIIFQMDVKGRFTSLNSEWELVTAYSASESIGTPCMEYIHQDDRELFQNILSDLVVGHRDGLHKELRLVSRQGEAKLAHLFIQAESDPKGETCSLSGTLTDIGSRRSSIEAYIENESNFRFISDHMTDMIAVLAEDGLVLYASPSHTTILGRTLDEYIGSYPIIHMHPDDWEKVFHAFQTAVSSWSEFEVDYRCMHSDGHWIDIEMRGKPTKGADGLTQVILVSRDITQRKKAEEELRRTTLKFRTLIASLPFGIKFEDETGSPIVMNDAYHELSAKVSPFLGDEANLVDHRQTLLGKEIGLPDGTIIERDAVPIIDQSDYEGYLWIYRDITEKKRIEQSLREANQQLRNLSMKDGLTSVANRRCFDEVLEREWRKQAFHSGPISLLLLDIDHFKAYNDLYGHQAGDAILKMVGQILGRLPLGTSDLAARYGGEEFVVLLPGRWTYEAKKIAQSIIEAVEAMHIPHKGSTVGEFLTLSIGISTMVASNFNSSTQLITEADRALYEAKRIGRNQCRVYNQN
jgi:diguanylate cyclase (GGDEF)-like protein/PAS domain S-box-containing protein